MTKFFLPLFLSFSSCFFSCDESSVVGLDVQPANDILNTSSQDTTTLVTRTIREDSLRTDELNIVDGTSLLGKYIDPVFGEATASLYTQVALSTNIALYSFGLNPICDSIVLSLVYDPSCYGKRDREEQTLQVYQLTEAVPTGIKYSNKTLPKDPTALATFPFIPRPTDSVLVAGVKQKPQLRVPLNIGFGQNFLDNPAAVMKGLYITTENTSSLGSGEGNIMKFRMAESKITMYYHFLSKSTGLTPPSPNIVYAKYDFGLGGVARFTHFTHNYSSADINLTSQLSATPPADNEVTFIQSTAGLKTKIEMPTLMHWRDGGAIAINKAELVIKADLNPTYQLDTFAFASPPALLIYSVEDNGYGGDETDKNFFIPDFFEGFNHLGGIYNAETKEYRFNIARYIQQVLDGKLKNGGLYILASGAPVRANRVVIGGGKNTSAYQMKLNITYTKLH